MNNESYQDDFELFLRESVDEFKMYPTRKIWRGIYNDVHPAKKWPSLAITLVFVATLLYVGISNNYRINTNFNSGKERKVEIVRYGRIYNEELLPLPNKVIENTVSVPSAKNDLSIASKGQSYGLSPMLYKDQQRIGFGPAQMLINHNLPAINFRGRNIDVLEGDFVTTVTNHRQSEKPTEMVAEAKENATGLVNLMQDTLSQMPELSYVKENEEAFKPENNYSRDIQQRQNFYYTGMSPYVIKRINKRNKYLQKLSYGFYITPSVGYRAMIQTKSSVNAQPAYANTLLNVNNRNLFKSPQVNQFAAFNMEAGLGVDYSLNKALKIRLGFQVNHTSYGINAIELSHPTQTYLNLTNRQSGEQELVPVITNYALEGNFSEYGKRLSSSSLHVSFPVGVDLVLVKNGRASLSLGSTIQPTVVAAGKPYLFSYDGKNYVEATNLVRKFNINIGTELIGSYKLNSGINVIAGPQFRYQLKSSYQPSYNYEEFRYNMGLKIGFTKKILEDKK